MGTGQYRSFHTSARGFLCLFITDKIGQHILCGMPYACWDNKPWNTAVPFSPFRQIRGSSHLSFWKKPIGICRQNLQISGRKNPANSWYTRLSAYGIYTVCGFWWTLTDLNRWPPARQAGALASWAKRPWTEQWYITAFQSICQAPTRHFLK